MTEWEGGNKERVGWMVSLTQWTWVWPSSGSWWWTGKSGVLQSMGSQTVVHYWATEFSSVQSLSGIQIFENPWAAACQAPLSITNSWSLIKLMSIESVIPCNHLILCCPLLLLPSTFPNNRVFSKESVLHIRWPKYWSFSVSPSNGYSGLIFFRIDWFDLLVVQGTLKSLLQHHSSKASILQHSAFLMVHLSHSYMITGKTIVLTIMHLCQQSDVSAF